MSDVILKNEIKTKTHLYALAEKQKDEGKTDLAEIIVLNKGPKKITELIKNTWDMQNAATEIELQNKTRMDQQKIVSQVVMVISFYVPCKQVHWIK